MGVGHSRIVCASEVTVENLGVYIRTSVQQNYRRDYLIVQVEEGKSYLSISIGIGAFDPIEINRLR